MEKFIIISAKKSYKYTWVWVVGITGEEPKGYCTSAYKAMRFAYLLKARTGINISENCLARLSQEIAFVKGERMKLANIERFNQAEDSKIEAVAAQQRKEMEQPPKKKQRKPRKSAKVVPLK